MIDNQKQAFIENCKFKFKCNKTWNSLEIKDDYSENRRFCGQCEQDVYFINSEAELQIAILNNYCVSIPAIGPVHFPESTNPDDYPRTTGVLMPPEVDKKSLEESIRKKMLKNPFTGLDWEPPSEPDKLDSKSLTPYKELIYSPLFFVSVIFFVVLVWFLFW